MSLTSNIFLNLSMPVNLPSITVYLFDRYQIARQEFIILKGDILICPMIGLHSTKNC